VLPDTAMQFIPESALDEANRADEAKQWASQQRSSVAQTWANNQRQKLAAAYDQMMAQYAPQPAEMPVHTQLPDTANAAVSRNPATPAASGLLDLLNGPLAGPLVGALRQAGGIEQIGQETAGEYKRLNELAARLDAGDQSVLPEIEQLEARLNQAYGEDPYKAVERNPTKGGLDLLGGLTQGAAAIAIAPGLASGLTRNLAAGAIDPGGQVLGSGLETAGRAAGQIGKAATGKSGLVLEGPERFYHGTNAAFDEPDPTKFQNRELYGPGYYLTNDPRVASNYAMEGRATDAISGPNVRPVDVPPGVRLLDDRTPLSPEEFRRIAKAVKANASPEDYEAFMDELPFPNEATGSHIWSALHMAGIRQGDATALLEKAGYDGILHAGGQNRPLLDEAGNAVQHQNLVIFPGALSKITNPLSGGHGLLAAPETLTRTVGRGAIQGAVGGGAEASRQENATPEAIAQGAVSGAAMGALRGGVGNVAGARAASTVLNAATRLADSSNAAKPITLTAEQEVARLNLEKILPGAPQHIKDFVADVARQNDFYREQRRGVIPDAAAQGLADEGQKTIEYWIKQSRAGKAYNTEELRQIGDLYAGQAKRVSDIAARNRALGPNNVTAIQRAEEIRELERLVGIQRVFEGGRAEWGRAGHAFSNPRIARESPEEAVVRITKKLGGTDNVQRAIDEFHQMLADGADPIQMAQFWSRVEKPPVGFTDWFKLLRYNSMLSGPRTFEINLIGNSLEVPWRLMRDTAASTLRGRPEEMIPELAGMWAGFGRGLTPAWQTLRHGITEEAAAAGDISGSVSARVTNPLARGAATTLEIPGRLNQAGDELARSMAYSMGLGRQAAVRASKEGLRGDEWKKRVAELLADPDEGTMKAANSIAQRMTYKGQMGGIGSWLGAGQQKSPIVANIILPFLKTVYHITSRGVDRSPVGWVGTVADVARGKYKSGQELPEHIVPLGERVGDNLMGLVLGAGLAYYGVQGNLSAAGPDDANKRRLLMTTGWRPYAIKIGNEWHQYTNWGPLAVPLGLAGSWAEAVLYADEGKDASSVAMDTASRFARLGTEQTYLQSVGDVYKAINDFERYGERPVTSLFTSLVPYGSGLSTAAQAGDPYQRDIARSSEVGYPEHLSQAMMARLPGQRQTLPVSQDAMGQPEVNQQSGLGALNPLRSTAATSDPAIQELLNADVDFGGAPKTINNIPLEPEEQRRYEQLAGEQIRKSVEKAIASAVYQRATPEGRRKILESAVASGREYASGQVLKQIGTTAIRERLAAARSGGR
jgi:hypothetical protein